MLITSTKNERIKAFQKLEKSSERKKEEVFIIEGIREIQRAVANGYVFREVFYCPTLVSEVEVDTLLKCTVPKTAISHHVFEAIAYRENRDGIVALARPKFYTLENLLLGKNTLLVVLEAVEKPGNLGAILRTADAAGADAVIVCDPKTDIYNPNVIRSSVGCVFSKPVVCCQSHEAIEFFKQKGIQTLATTPAAQDLYFEQNLQIPLAIVMGTEADGLSDVWLQNTDMQVKVPMLGIADSLNVSACLAAVVYEAVRQRHSKNS